MLFINSENQIYSEDKQGNDRELTPLEQSLYMRGYGYELQNGQLVDITNKPEYISEQLEKEKQKKLIENEQKRQVKFITTSIGRLKTETPLGDLKTAIPLYEKIVSSLGKLPANTVRLYDLQGNISGNDELNIEQFDSLLVEVAFAYVAIDAKSTQYVQAIMAATTINAVDSIIIEY